MSLILSAKRCNKKDNHIIHLTMNSIFLIYPLPTAFLLDLHALGKPVLLAIQDYFF